MRNLPPLAAVRVFEAAARHLNFTAAAAELGMTQAAVSYQIRMIEARLGQPLFLRHKGRVTLADAGRRLAPAVTGAFDMLGDAFAAVRVETAAVLTISSASSFAANWLAPRLGGFQLAHTDLAVRLNVSNTLVDFARDEVDVALRLTSTPAPGLHADRLFAVCLAPMASPGFLARFPMTVPADLLTVPRLTPDDIWWRRWFAHAGVADPGTPQPGLRLDSQTIEGAAAIAGQGVAILSPELWRREVADGRLVAPFATAPAGSSFWLVCPEDRRNVARIKAFRIWLLAEVAAAEPSGIPTVRP